MHKHPVSIFVIVSVPLSSAVSGNGGKFQCVIALLSVALMASRAADWLPRCRGGKGAWPARYMYRLARLSRGIRVEETRASEPTSTDNRTLDITRRPPRTPPDSTRSTPRRRRTMLPVYRQLVRLLLALSSLQQLAEGCSCALSHPQDAFCNSDIGE